MAAEVGSKSVRCDPGKFDPKKPAPTVDSYRQLSEYGRSRGVHVIIENHGGVGSEHPEDLVQLFKAVGGEHVGSLPDFMNFNSEAIREKGLELLFPYARVVCHAKGMEFDASGAEKQYNFAEVHGNFEEGGIQRDLLDRIRGARQTPTTAVRKS